MTLRITEREGYYHVYGTHRGVRVRKSTGVPAVSSRYNEATEILKQVRRNMGAGATKPRITVLFIDVADDYLNRPEGVAKNDRLTIRRFCTRFGGRQLDEITTGLLENYIRDHHRRNKPGTIKRELVLLRAILNRAKRAGHLDLLPTFPMPRVDDERHSFYTDKERDAIIDACTGVLAHMRVFCLVAFYTGARPNEIARLTWEQVNLRRNEITFTSKKGMRTRRRTVPIHERLKNALLDLPHRTGHVCLNAKGKPWAVGDGQRPAIHKPFAEACEVAGVKTVRPYDMRHTFGSQLYLNGVDVLQIKELMGHATLNQTMRYTHIAAASRLHHAVGALT